MSQTLQNQILNCKSMNGIITLSDGNGTIISNGQISTGNISGQNISGTSITGTSFSTLNKSQLETVLTLSTGGANTPYTWAYNSAQYIIFTGTSTQVFVLPVVLSQNLGTNIVIYKQAGGTFTINAPVGYNLYDFNNASLNSRPLNSNDRWISLVAVSTGTTQWQMISQTSNSLINATLSLSQSFTGLKTFTAGANFITVLPTTSLAPTLGTQLVNKTYADSIGTTLLSSNNVWTGTNDFNTSLPTSTLTPSSNTQLVTKVYADALPITLRALNNIWTGTNAFDTSIPTTILTPTLNTQLITKVYADAIPTTLRSSNNVWTGTNAFNTSLPTSTLTPSSNTQLVTKLYADGLPITLRALNNTWTGTNQFNNNVTMGTAGYFLPYFPLTSTSMRMGLNTLENSLATSTNCLVWGNGAMQGTTNVAYTNLHTNTICIGNNAMSGTTYGTSTTSNNDNVIIGDNSSKGINLSSNDNVVIGSQTIRDATAGSLLSSVVIGAKINVNSGIPQRTVIIGSNQLPNTAANDAVCIGYGNLAFTALSYFNGGVIVGSSNLTFATAFNRVICVGEGSLTNIDNNVSTISIGMESLVALTTGTFVASFGSFVVCNNNLTNCTILGTYSNTTSTSYANNSLYIGGNDNAGNFQDILIAKKNRAYCTQTILPASSATSILLEFETPENVVIDNVNIININLPAILANFNVGTKFSITRSNIGTSGITIDAGTGYFIQSGAGLAQTISWTINEQFITLVCVSTTKWNVVCNDVVNKIITTNTSTNATFYPTFVASNTNGAYQGINMNTNITANPSTGLLSATTIEATTLKQTGLNGFAGNYSAVGGTLTLAFGDNENVIFDSSPVVTVVNLPSVGASNLGAKFTFISRIGNRNYNLIASGTERIWDFKRQYATSTFVMNGIGSLTLIATGTGGGNNCWSVSNRADGTASAYITPISTNFSIGTATNLPIRDAYSVANGATAITITFPTIDLNNVGTTVLFRRTQTTTAIVSFIGDGTQFVYNNALTGGAGAQALMGTAVNIIRFNALVVNATPTYAWFQV